jgi:hypothetical protein
MKPVSQKEAVNYVERVLIERGFHVPSRRLADWIIFDYEGKQLGIDSTSGVWARASETADWRCFAKPCTVSGAIQAVEFLTT